MLVAMSGTGSLEAPAGARAPSKANDGQDEQRTSADPAQEAPRPAGLGPGWLWWVGLVVVALPFVASAITIFLDGGYHPSADVAGTELITRDVGRYQLLLGPFSRDGWYHPGPALYYVLAVPYRLLGGSPSALAAGALVVNGLSLVGIGWIAKRRGGVPLMLCTLLTSLLMVRALGFEFLATPWNPWVTVLPYALLVMLTWAMTCGERWALPVAALVTTFVVQTHVGYAVLALPLAGFGALWLLVGEFRSRRARREAIDARGAQVGEKAEGDADAPAAAATADGEADMAADGVDGAGSDAGPAAGPDAGHRARWTARPLVWALAATGVVLVVAWLPPVVQQLTHEPGNLGVVVRWFGERSEDSRTFGDAWAVMGAQYAWNPEWLTGAARYSIVGEPFYVTWPRIPVLLVFVAVAAVAGWRRPGGDARRLLAVWGVASALAALGVLRTVGLLYGYRLKSTWPLAAIIGAYCLWVGWVWLAERWPRLERRVFVPVVAAAVVVVAGIDIGSAVKAGIPEEEQSVRVGALGDQIAEVLPADIGPVRVVPTSFLAMGYASGVQANLENRGFDTRKASADTYVEDHRTPPRDPAATLQVVTDEKIPEVIDNPDAEMIAYASDLTVDELRTMAAERLEAVEGLGAAQAQGDDVALEEYARLADMNLPVNVAAAVFLVEPGSATADARGPSGPGPGTG